MLCLLLFSQIAYANKNSVDVYYKGKNLQFKNNVFKDGTVVYIPLREFSDNIKTDVLWDKDKKEVIFLKDKDVLIMKDKSNLVKCNGKNIRISKPTKIIKGVFYVPSDLLINCLDYGVNIDKNVLKIYDRFDVIDVKQEGVINKGDLLKKDLDKLNKALQEIELKYGVSLVEESTIDIPSIGVFYNYINEYMTRDEIMKEDKWGDHFVVTIDKDNLDFYSKWKVVAPLAGMHSRFEPVVYYRLNDKDYVVGGYENYLGSEKNLDKALKNYLNTFERVYDEKPTKDVEKAIKKELKSLMVTVNSNKVFKVFLVKDTKINKVY